MPAGDLEFKNVRVTLSSRAGERTILNASGHVPEGSFVAIIGGSGSSKSTLLNALSAKLSSTDNMEVTGEVFVGSHRMTQSYFLANCAFVPQFSCLLPALTPRETVMNSSILRQPALSKNQHQKRCEQILTQLHLNNCADNMIGDDNLTIRGCSGGEVRRVNMAIELVHQPKIIFCDECTTGLDSANSLKIITLLASLTQPSGRATRTTVITTIHQPSKAVFEMFHWLILMCRGHVVYCGPSVKALEYFATLGHPCSMTLNQPEFFCELLHEYDARGHWEQLHRAHTEHSRLQLQQPLEHKEPDSPVAADQLQRQPFMQQCLLLTRRSSVSLSRMPMIKIGRIMQSGLCDIEDPV